MWNSFAPQFMNGISYQAPKGFLDVDYSYVFSLPQNSSGIALPHASTVELDAFTEQGTAFLCWGLILPPYSDVGGGLYGYNAGVQLFVNEEVMATEGLTTAAAYANQSSPLPMLSQRWIAPGTTLRIVVTSFETATDYANFQIVLRGTKRYQIGASS